MQLEPKNLRILSSRGNYRLHLLLFHNKFSILSYFLNLATSNTLLPCSPTTNATFNQKGYL